jgi:8'-apo-carotenoid 13,14-cleaving dioxygenase
LLPIVVASRPDAAEDDGWLMTYVGDLRTRTSELVILHAQVIKAGPIARVAVPHHVPIGFHGNFFRDLD